MSLYGAYLINLNYILAVCRSANLCNSPSGLINGYVPTVWFIICCWPQSQTSCQCVVCALKSSDVSVSVAQQMS